MIGNPPYGDGVIDKTQTIILSKSLGINTVDGADGTKNGASVFIEKSVKFLNTKGCLGFIVPNSITRVQRFKKIRKFLLSEVNLFEIVDEGKAFKDVTLEMITIFLNKRDLSENIKITIRRKELPVNIQKKEYMLKKSIFSKYYHFTIYWDELFNKVNKESKTHVLDAKRGGDIQKKKIQDETYNIPYLFSGKSVKAYLIDFNYIEFIEKKCLRIGIKAKEDYDSEFLVATKIYPYPRATYKPKGYVIGANVIKIINNSNFSNKFILGLLNSNLIQYYCSRYLVNFSQLTIGLNTGQLPLIPIKDVSEKEQESFIELVDKILLITKSKYYQENKQKQEEVKIIRDKIDELVYKLYDLTDDEIKIIERST